MFYDHFTDVSASSQFFYISFNFVTIYQFPFQDPDASYDYNSNDADPAPRATWNDENRLVID